MRNCQAKDCTAEGNWFPTMNFWAVGHKPGSHPPGQMMLGLVLCEACMLKFKAEFILTDENWARLQSTYSQMGKLPPCRKSAKLIGVHWEQAPVAWRNHWEATR